jgi:uncharacterized damage-inducible protein DinB
MARAKIDADRAGADEDIRRVLVESWVVNERMNQVVLEHLDPAAWRGKLRGVNGRTIAVIVSHMHNMRRKWIRLSAPQLKVPAAVDRGGARRLRRVRF